MPQVDAAELDLRVERVAPEAEGVISVDLVPPNGHPLPRWQPGAHIDIVTGSDLERQYSLCGDPDDDRVLRVAVLREPESRGGSKWIHEMLKVGDLLRVRGPRNNFELVEAEEYLFIAGGIGITPILPMIAACEARAASWRLVYGGRTRASMAFTEVLETYGDRVQIWPQDERGFITIAEFLGEPRARAAVYCCGPGPLLDAVEAATVSWPSSALHVERFRPKAGALDGPNTAFDVRLEYSGVELRVEAGQSIVEACSAVGIHIPTSCREGTCGTCETELLEGDPDHRDSFLTDEEKESGEIIMPCCSRACSSSLVLGL